MLDKFNFWEGFIKDLDWDEDEHPRDELGRWTFKGGGDSPTAEKEAQQGPTFTPHQIVERVQKHVAMSAKHDWNSPLLGSQATHPATISSRLSVREEDKNPGTYRRPKLDEVAAVSPKIYNKVADYISQPQEYPQLRPEDIVQGSPQLTVRHFIDVAKSNVRFLYDKTPKEDQERTKIWYDGAHMRAEATANRTGLPFPSVVGVYAALSPQKDWFENVYLAERLIDDYEHQQDTEWVKEENGKPTAMEQKARDLFTNAYATLGRERDDVPKVLPKGMTPKKWVSAWDTMRVIESVQNKKLGELRTPEQKAIWLRVYDETNHTREFHTILPTGENGPLADYKAGWQSIDTTAKAIRALESGGDRTVISNSLGTAHKVRSFYNNILDPHSANGDVTIDTHAAGAALLMPIGATDSRIGDAMARPGDVETGARGLYLLYAQAYREVAHDLGLQPRQLQSVVWETKRKLMENVPDASIAYVNNEWEKYRTGGQSLQVTQENIYDHLDRVRTEKQRKSAAANGQ